MPTYKRKTDYFETEEGIEIMEVLRSMSLDKAYNTESTYSPNTELYPNNLIPFVEKHMDYLRNHPSTNPIQYLANLRLMTRIE